MKQIKLETLYLNKKQIEALYNFVLGLQNGHIPIVFEEVAN